MLNDDSRSKKFVEAFPQKKLRSTRDSFFISEELLDQVQSENESKNSTEIYDLDENSDELNDDSGLPVLSNRTFLSSPIRCEKNYVYRNRKCYKIVKSAWAYRRARK